MLRVQNGRRARKSFLERKVLHASNPPEKYTFVFFVLAFFVLFLFYFIFLLLVEYYYFFLYN